jgi:ADP-ribose pyrophosphatase YjhB (NUDIX family)
MTKKDTIHSPIQNRIISLLKNKHRARYSELQIEGEANDLFNYHLQFLVKKGIVVKDEQGYFLSELGLRIVADANTIEQGDHLFKVNVIMVVSRKNGKEIEILNQLRKSHPSYGKIGVPGGVVYKEEPIIDAAKRKLQIETGLSADFRLLGFLRRYLYKDGELFSDVFFPIVYSDNYSGEIISRNNYGENMWVPIDEAIKNESAKYDSLKSLPRILNAIKNKKINSLEFFYEEDAQIDG